jgi:putative spermidine/putrescine transport system ATP-binding protein
MSDEAPPTSPNGLPAISLVHLHKRYGDVVAVGDVSLDIQAGEFFTLLGPSGSGKTTVLRMIAGFEQATSGTVLLDGNDVTKKAPFDRDVNTVFQDYALFPHMTVQKNVEYGLMVKKVPKAARFQRATEALEAVRLREYGHRRPSQLSGGQRQRVALARALINRPKVLLLDEPLGALDLKLREEMQVELKSIQHDVGITFVFVTHDQDEALTMSDRIAVFDQGNIVQIGTPQQVYDQPTTRFVAGFVGTSNILSGSAAMTVLGRDGTFAIRPERFRVLDATQVSEGAGASERVVTGRITTHQFVGSETRLRVRVDGDAGTELSVVIPHIAHLGHAFSPGDSISLAVQPELATAIAN